MSEVDNIVVLFSKCLSWVLSASIMASILICLILLIRIVLKNRLGARWKYLLWFLLIFRLVSPWAPESSLSVFNLLSYKSNGETVPIIRNTGIYNIGKAELAAQKSNKPSDQSKKSNSSISSENQIGSSSNKDYFKTIFFSFKTFSVIWLTGAAFMAMYMLILNRRLTSKIRKHSLLPDSNILYIFRKCKDRMNIFNDIPLIVTNQVKSPTLFGVITPKLLLPEQLLGGLSSNQLNYIFLHELAHFKRKDIAVNLLMSVLLIFHWFNPLLFYAFYKIHEDQETACDASALSYVDPTEVKEYAFTIIKILESFAKTPTIPVMAGFSGTKTQLKKRIRMIKSFKKNSNRWSVTGAVFLTLLALITLTDARAGVLNNTAIANNPDSILKNYEEDIKYKSKFSFLAKNQDERAISAIVMNFLNEVGNTDYRNMTGKEGIEYLVPARQGYENTWIDSNISLYKENEWVYNVYDLDIDYISVNGLEARAICSGKISRLGATNSDLSNVLRNPFQGAFTLKKIEGKWLINNFPSNQTLAGMQLLPLDEDNSIRNTILGYLKAKYNRDYKTVTGIEGYEYFLSNINKIDKGDFKENLDNMAGESIKMFKDNQLIEKLKDANVYLVYGNNSMNIATAKCIWTLSRTDKAEKTQSILIEEEFTLQKYNGDWLISSIESMRY